MSTQLRAFRPLGNNQTQQVVTAVGPVGLTLTNRYGTQAVRLVNSGTDITFLEFSTAAGSPVASVTTSIPMLPNTVEVFTLAPDIGVLKIVGVAGGNTLYITLGEGL